MPIVGSCDVCRVIVSKYKCPVCLLVYCSVACYKTHKQQGNCNKVTPEDHKEQERNELVTTESLDQEAAYEFETEDTVPPEKLRLLDENPVIQRLLKDKHLRDLILKLESSKGPYEAFAEAMKDPVYEEFATQCLHTIEGNASDEESDDSI